MHDKTMSWKGHCSLGHSSMHGSASDEVPHFWRVRIRLGQAQVQRVSWKVRLEYLEIFILCHKKEKPMHPRYHQRRLATPCGARAHLAKIPEICYS